MRNVALAVLAALLMVVGQSGTKSHDAAAQYCGSGWQQVNYSAAYFTGIGGYQANHDITACRSGGYIKYISSIWGTGLNTPRIAIRFWICGQYWQSINNVNAWVYSTGPYWYGCCGAQADNLYSSVYTPYQQVVSYFGGSWYDSVNGG
jgi:hypothetical protein